MGHKLRMAPQRAERPAHVSDFDEYLLQKPVRKPNFAHCLSLPAVLALSSLSLSACIVLEGLSPNPQQQPGNIPTASSPPENFDTASAPLPVQRVSQPSLKVAEDLQEVSGEFSVRFPAPQRNYLLEIPVARENLPADLKPAQLQMEHRKNGVWQPTGRLVEYNRAKGTVSFEVTAPAAGFATRQASGGEDYFRIRIYLFKAILSVTRPGSAFRIHYYPSGLGYSSSVLSDSQWNSTTGKARDADVPDFVEDLDFVLNEAYPAMMLIFRSDGKPLFEREKELMDVYITNTGEEHGNSDLGGPISLSNSKNADFKTLKNTGAHELAHLLQGQHYSLKGTFTGRQNRAFIEATANYLSADVNELTPEDRKAYYQENSSDYLSVPLYTATDFNHYAAAHFLDWVSDKYGYGVVPDALSSSSTNNLEALSQAIKARDASASLLSAYLAYGRYLFSHPENMAGFALAQKGKMGAYATNNGHLSNNLIGRNGLYSRYSRNLPPLSMGHAFIKGSISQDALLVIHAEPQRGSLASQTYQANGFKDSDYTSPPLDDTVSFFNGEDLSYPHFASPGQPSFVEQVFINPSQVASAQVNVHYYLLQAQDVTAVEDGKVSWSNDKVTGIPPALIKGFKIYFDGEPVSGSELVAYNGSGTQSFLSSAIRSGQKVQVSVLDQSGNEWPPRPDGSSASSGTEPGSSEVVNIRLVNLGSQSIGVGQKREISVTVSGTSNTAVSWELDHGAENSDATLVGNGLSATFTAPSFATFECIRARSKANPKFYAQGCLTVTEFPG